MGSSMYNLHLSAEQLEIRNNLRDFVDSEVKPVTLRAERLDVRDRMLPMAVLDQASQMGLRSLALSEERGGAGADTLTECLVAEELAAGDADVAAILTETSRLAGLLFDRTMNDAQRERFLAGFLKDDRCHLAYAAHEPGSDTRLGVNYHRPESSETGIKTTAVPASGGGFVINGVKDCVANAPIASLFAVLAQMSGRPHPSIVIVAANAPGISVETRTDPWQHGSCGAVTFKDCRVPAGNLLDEDAAIHLNDAGNPLPQAVNLGIGRAAYEAALDYAHLRVQGSRPLIEHQAIATKLAESAIRLDIARTAVWRAAWGHDHPEAVTDRSLPNLPLQTMAQVFTSEAIMKVAKDCAEVFGAMGVMRDMPLQKYIHDARVCLHSGDGNSEAKLRLAEQLAGFRRPTAGAMALACE